MTAEYDTQNFDTILHLAIWHDIIAVNLFADIFGIFEIMTTQLFERS